MLPLERVGLEAFFDTSAFQRGQAIYERGLARVDSTTTKTARKLSAAWGDSTAGLDDLFSRMDAAKGQADELAAGYAALGDEAVAVAAGLGTIGAAATGVGIGLAIVGAAGVAVWRKIDDAAMEYLARSEEVVKAQDGVNDEWDRASRHLAQTLIPLKVELLNVELKLATAVADVTETFGKLVAIAHSSIAAIVAGLGAIPEAIVMAFRGEKPVFEDLWETMTEAGEEAFGETMLTYRDAFEETFPEIEEEAEDSWEKIADAVSSAMQRIEDMQVAHGRRLSDLADDYAVRQARSWAKYEKAVAKEIDRGLDRIAKLEASYNKRRAKTIADYQKRIARAEADASEARVKAQEDYDRRERQARERYQLDMLQSERRYQFERNRLVAEGDTLAIEELDARYKLEQEEAAENEALRQKQSREGQAEQIREAGEAAREQVDELRQQLAETLAEQEANYLEQIEGQRQANQDRLAEIHISYAEQQRLADEDYQMSIEKANLNYQRQQEDLGRNLARQEEMQELGAGEVATLLERYYGEDGVADRIMEGWHERENARILVTAALMTQMGEWKPLLPGGIPMPGQQVGMQMGGILQGPAMAYVEPGVTEAFVPLTGAGAGGAFTHEFLNALSITGLEGASQTDVSRIARELAVSLTQKIRSRRRH
jgi:hypothetical protein